VVDVAVVASVLYHSCALLCAHRRSYSGFDLTVCLLRRVILPSPWLVPLTLLLLLLGCVSSVQPSATTFIGLAVFLHYLKQLLQGLRFDSVKHVLAVSYPQTPDNGINGAAFGHPRRTRCQLHHSVHILLQ
jgi:hypothetical protein